MGAAPAVGIRASTRLGRRLEVRAAAKLGLLGWELEAGALQRLLQRGAVGLTASCGAQVTSSSLGSLGLQHKLCLCFGCHFTFHGTLPP